MTQRLALFLAPIYPPKKGGAAIHFEQICSNLLKRDILDYVIILTCHTKSTKLVQFEDQTCVLRILIPSERVRNSDIVIFNIFRFVFNLVIVLLTVVVLVGIFRTDIVHTQTKEFYSWGCKAASLLGSNIIIDGRDLGAPEFGPTGDVFVVCSRNVEAKAAERTEPVEHIPVGIDVDDFPKLDPSERPLQDEYLLFVGDIVERKGVNDLLGAYRDLDIEYPLVLVGEALDKELISVAEQIDKVYYAGPKPHKRTIQYISNAKLVILPSYSESIGRVVLESFIVGTPAICPPNVPEYSDEVPELVLPEVTEKHISKKIREILTQPYIQYNYPVERHFRSNTLDEYERIYKTYMNDI